MLTAGTQYRLPSRANELIAMSRLRLTAVVVLLTGHTPLTPQPWKLGLTNQQYCRLCEEDKEDSVHTARHCPVLACQRYRTWCSMFLRPKDLEEVRVGSFLSPVANTRLGLAP